MGAKSFLKNTWNDLFKRYMILALIILGIALFIFSNEAPDQQTPDTIMDVYFVHSPTCTHCNDQKAWLKQIKPLYPEINFVEIDITNQANKEKITQLYEQYKVPQDQWGLVPIAFVKDEYIIGFDNAEGIGSQITQKLNTCAALTCNATAFDNETEPVDLISDSPETVDAGVFGEIKVADYSLAALSVILGLVDGFNPCAMWVLVYLISIVIGLKDRRRIWLIVGTFVLASGILYYLFMTAWLNVFLFIGYFRPVMIVVGLAAVGFAALSLREYFTTKGALVCKVGDAGSKKKTMERIKKLVSSPMSVATMLGIIALAFIVNSIEFVCSSAIPAVYTSVLALSGLAAWQQYLYILLYVFFFMLDDLIIFGLAAFAVNTTVGEKYAKQGKLIGGILMAILGIVLLFFPQWLI